MVLVISRGWNQYQFEKYAPMIKNGYSLNEKESFIRNRNLFYVCCSRPKKRLFIFVSIPIDEKFRKFLIDLAGSDNVITYKDFIDNYSV